MSERLVRQDSTEVAITAANMTVDVLGDAIAARGEAVWVLAGGTAPMATYGLLASDYTGALDWSRVKLLLGDERCVPPDHQDASWGQIDEVFMSRMDSLSPENLFRPPAELGPEDAAQAYEAVLADLSPSDGNAPEFDLVWLGMGEDGHTLSLFPGREELDSKRLVIPVYDSPKPPPERVSLTLGALHAARHCLIMATGAGKAPILDQISAGDHTLPIVRAAETVESNGGSVLWLLDAAAAGSASPQ